MPGIDKALLKQRITYGQVLSLLGWRHVRVEAGRFRGGCPVHQQGREHGDCFAVGEMGWTCHSCKAHGNQLDLWLQATGQAFRPGVLDLCGRLGVDVPYLPRGPRQPRPPRTEKRPRQGGRGGLPRTLTRERSDFRPCDDSPMPENRE